MAKEMVLDRATIEFQTVYFPHVLVVPPNLPSSKNTCKSQKRILKKQKNAFGGREWRHEQGC